MDKLKDDECFYENKLTISSVKIFQVMSKFLCAWKEIDGKRRIHIEKHK